MSKEEIFVSYKFKDTALKANVPNAYGVIYPKEILKKAVEQIKQLNFGVILEAKVITCKEDLVPCLSDSAFTIEDAEFNDPNLDITIKTINTPKGKLASEMLKVKEEVPLSLGIAGYGETESLDNGNLVVKDFVCQRVSLLSKEDKA
jgi:hypothetical protein